MNILDAPDSFKRCIAKSDRKGPAGMTSAEGYAASEFNLELAFHEQLSQYLNFKRICFCHANPTKKSNIRPGWPDFTMAVRGHAVAFELKGPNGTLSDEQEAVRFLMEANGWIYVVVKNLGQVKSVLNDLENPE